MPSDPAPKAPTWLVLATLVWWCVGVGPLAWLSAVLIEVGFFGRDGYRAGLIGLGCAVLAGVGVWWWSRPQNPRKWVEILRGSLMAVPCAGLATVALMSQLSSTSRYFLLGTDGVIPHDVSLAGGALFTGSLVIVAVRLNVPEGAPGRSVMSSANRRALVVLTLVAALAGVGLAVARWRWAAQERAALESLARDGLGVDVPTLFPPGLPADGSAALLEARRLLGDEEPPTSEWFLLRNSSPLTLRAAFEAPEGAASLLDFKPDGPNPGPPDAVWDVIASIESRVAAAVPAIERSLAASAVRVPWSRDDPAASVPQFRAAFDLILGLRLRAAHAQLLGRPEEAWRDASRMVRLGAHFDPDVMSVCRFRVRQAEDVARAIGELLELGPPPSAATAREIDGALEALEQPETLTRALRGELALTLHRFASSPADLDREVLCCVPPFFVRGHEDLSGFELMLFRPKWRRDYVVRMAEIIRASVRSDSREQLVQIAGRPRSLFADGLLGFVDSYYTERDQAIATTRLARLALAVAIQADGGGLPDVPSVEVPRDPCDPAGAPLRYRKRGPRDVLLWSVGPDGVDDDGRGYDPPRHYQGQEGYDIAFELELPDR